MEQFTLAQVAQWTGGTITESTPTLLMNISTDSRNIPPDALFVPIVGERFDGHDFIQKAVMNGAAAVVSHHPNEKYTVPTVYVPHTSQALLDIAGGYRRLCGDSKIVAVTGSVGKTTTKELLYAALSPALRVKRNQGNLNNEIGLPLTLCQLTYDTQVMVTEMGMNHFGEISRMTAAARPDIAVITNIGTSHIEYLGSREGICKAKLEILEGLRPNGCAVFCGDEPLLWEKRNDFSFPTYTYGLQNVACDLTAEIHSDGSFSVYNRSLPNTLLPIGDSFRVKLQILGAHNICNALAAVIVGLLLGQSPETISSGLSSCEMDGLRQHIYMQNGFRIFADCYNASPDAMEAVLKVLGAMAINGGRRFAVLGSMLELGHYTEEGHRRAGRAAAQNADALYAYGSYAHFIAAGAAEYHMNCVYLFQDQLEMAEALRKDAKPGDTLLFKGSRGMRMERVLALFLGEDVTE